MTQSQRWSVVLIVSVTAILVLNGCAASKPQSFAMSFLPATPLPIAADVRIEKPPEVNKNLYRSEPNLVPVISPEVERRLKLADERFADGRKAYQAGDAALARLEFDRALDVLLSAPESLADRSKLERRLDEMVDAIYRYDLDELGAGDRKKVIVYDKSPLDGMLEMTFPVDPKLKPQVKEEILATLSQLPLEQNDTVLSYIHFFSSDRGRKSMIAGLRRAGKYRPLIQRILNEEGVPEELISLAQAESGFLPRAVSYKRATGMWQFVKFRGREYGLDQTALFDDRMDPEKATRAAARHLRDLYAMFGDWYLAMAAYNCGPGCVDRAVQRTGYADFWELTGRNALPRQTLKYVPLILAITIMSKNPQDYGLDAIDPERPLEYDTMDMPSATNLDLIADITNRPVSEIHDLNPALLSSVAPAGYALHVPKASSSGIVAALANVPLEHRVSWRVHRVERGESLTEIAARFHTPATAIAAANNRTVEAPEDGDLLVIPAARQAQHASRRTKQTPLIARRQTSQRGYVSSVSPRVLQHRAGPRTIKTAGLYEHTAGGQ